MSRDAFGSELKLGTSLSVLLAAKKFFQSTAGLTILSYSYTRDCCERPKKFIKREDLEECSICGKELYAFVPRVTSLDSEPELYVKQKQHLKFVDTVGHEHTTCYKMNQCFKAVEFDASWAGSDGRVKPPALEDFLKLTDDLPAEIEPEIHLTYERVLLPFLIEWGNNEVTKQNVMRFVTELRDVERVWLVFFSTDPASQRMAKNNILTHVGVKYDR